ncbi:MAG: 30S ribosomal protein S12 methylthiotransferase RimO, partial [Oscillospiraceae bacterium]|nr:30S ribosomal protein S12 methylthiotransferase RimO [Oscillospiraceae bacterium]
EEIKERRAQLINEKQDTAAIEKLSGRIGNKYTVMVEGYDEQTGMYFGRSRYEAPAIDGKTFILSGKSDKRLKIGSFVDITALEVLNYNIVGKCD